MERADAGDELQVSIEIDVKLRWPTSSHVITKRQLSVFRSHAANCHYSFRHIRFVFSEGRRNENHPLAHLWLLRLPRFAQAKGLIRRLLGKLTRTTAHTDNSSLHQERHD